MFKVNSSQFNYQYGDQIHFPYSIASLVSFIKADNELKNNFNFEKSFVFRDKIDNYIQQCLDSDILMCSCYVWNWEITTHLAREVKKLNPKCTIIFGGPQVPNDVSDFFTKYPFVDIAVHGEGELILKNILNTFLNDQNYSNVKGISTKNFRNGPEDRIVDLDSIPSPFLTNTIWDLVEKIDKIKWICSWETNRGCPFECTFCDWGSATFTKMRNHSTERLFDEIGWFADNKIVYIDCCDSNFGMFPRDLELATRLKEITLQKGYPKTFRQSWAKNSSEKIIPIAKELQQGGLLTAVGLAVETLDERTLNIIKRRNMPFNKFSELTAKFYKNGLPTYTEIIRGLPAETLQSFKAGLESMVSDTSIDSIFIYNCSVLPNAPLNEPSYRKEHDIQITKSPIYLAHSSIHSRGIDEFEYIVTSCKSFTNDELKEMYLYSWLVLTFYSLGIFESISKYYNKEKELTYMKFFEIFLDFCKDVDTDFSVMYEIVKKYIDVGYDGKGWNYYEKELGDVYYPIEEATWLKLTLDGGRLEQNMILFLTYLEHKLDFDSDLDKLLDLAKFQSFLLTTRDDERRIKTEYFEWNWKNYFVGNGSLEKFNRKFYYTNKILESDDYEWNKNVIWYGRRSKKYKVDIDDLQEGEPRLVTSLIETNPIKPPP